MLIETVYSPIAVEKVLIEKKLVILVWKVLKAGRYCLALFVDGEGRFFIEKWVLSDNFMMLSAKLQLQINPTIIHLCNQLSVKQPINPFKMKYRD